MSHTDYIKEAPSGFKTTGYTNNCPCAVMENNEKKFYGVQFHPEVTHTEYGMTILSNFVFDVCECKADWKMDDFAKASIEKYRNELKDKKGFIGAFWWP